MKTQNTLNKKNKLLWSLLFLLLAAATVFAVVSQTKNFSFGKFFDFVKNSDPVYFTCAVLCMIGFIAFEGFAITVLCRAFRFKCSPVNGFLYSAADIYFSAITPSATGGQPACGYFMVRDGIPTMFTTVALIANLAAYALSTLTLGIVSIAARPALLMKFSLFSRILIYIGYAVQVVLIAFFTLMLKRGEIIASLFEWAMKLLDLLHFNRRAASLRRKFARKMEDYGRYSALLSGKRSMVVKVIIFNLLQKASQVMVTVFTYLACGGQPSRAFDIFCLQSYTVIGVNCIPIPGAMGITDYLMLDCFGSVMDELEATNLELLSRSISFYSCVIICGIAVIIKIIEQKRRSE